MTFDSSFEENETALRDIYFWKITQARQNLLIQKKVKISTTNKMKKTKRKRTCLRFFILFGDDILMAD